MRTFAVIPARGGSKGLPGKNIRMFNGKPLLAYMIEAAQKATLVDKIFISTDAQEIANVGREYGAEVIMRPESISGDTASSELALLHALDYLEKKGDTLPDLILLLQCTAPFTTSQDIDGTIKSLLDNKADSALAVTPFYHFLWEENAGKAKGINHDGKNRKMRQQLEPQYLEAGSVYAMRVPAFRQEKTRFCGVTSLYRHDDHHRCMEIDDAADFYQAEAMCSWFNRSSEEKENYRQKDFTIKTPFPEKLGALICDFDGVFTDNAVYTLQNGEECVRCDRSDGAGIASLKNHGVPVVVLSAEKNPVVKARCDKLRIECHQGVEEKKKFLEQWLAERELGWENIIYIGNDTMDRECLKFAGTGVTPKDAHESAKAMADVILDAPGGHGALRELGDMVCECLDASLICLMDSPNKDMQK